MNEAEIIHRARQGDQDAWLVLVRQHQTTLFRLAYLLLNDADAAEDVAQDALIRAYRQFAQFDTSRPLRPWLLQIVRNLASNHQRSARRYLAAVTRWWQRPDNRQAVALDPTIEEIAGADAHLLWQAVRRLKRSEQEIIYLRYYLELSVAESAQTLAIAEGTVKSRTARALQRLRTVVEQDYPTLRTEVD